MAAPTKDIKDDVLWIVAQSENTNGRGGTELRIVRWVADGKPGRPMLEKRDWFLTEQDDRRAGKAKGMTETDLYLVVKNIREIARLLEVKPQYLDEALQLAMKEAPPKTSAESTPASVGAPPDVKF